MTQQPVTDRKTEELHQERRDRVDKRHSIPIASREKERIKPVSFPQDWGDIKPSPKKEKESTIPVKQMLDKKFDSANLSSPGEDDHNFYIRPTIEKKPFPSPNINNQRRNKPMQGAAVRRPESEVEDNESPSRQALRFVRGANPEESQNNQNDSYFNDFMVMQHDVMIQQLILQAHAQARGDPPPSPPVFISPGTGRGMLSNNPRSGQAPDKTKKIDVYNPELSKIKADPEASTNGLSAVEINSIIPIKFIRAAVKSDDPCKLECNICLVPFKDGDKVKMLQCLHSFHSKCIGDWLSRKSICPECNFNLRTLDFKQLY